MKSIPENLCAFKRTPIFTQETIPAALLKDHKTNVWAVIQVRTGRLEYTIDSQEIYVLEPGKNGIVEPQVPHHIKPLGTVSFFVEFYK